MPKVKTTMAIITSRMSFTSKPEFSRQSHKRVKWPDRTYVGRDLSDALLRPAQRFQLGEIYNETPINMIPYKK